MEPTTINNLRADPCVSLGRNEPLSNKVWNFTSNSDAAFHVFDDIDLYFELDFSSIWLIKEHSLVVSICLPSAAIHNWLLLFGISSISSKLLCANDNSVINSGNNRALCIFSHARKILQWISDTSTILLVTLLVRSSLPSASILVPSVLIRHV